MKALLWLLAALALAAALSIGLRGNDGYALFVLHPWRIDLAQFARNSSSLSRPRLLW
jgi:hypothetical protein